MTFVTTRQNENSFSSALAAPKVHYLFKLPFINASREPITSDKGLVPVTRGQL